MPGGRMVEKICNGEPATLKALGVAGDEVLVFGNLSTSHREAVLHDELRGADLADIGKAGRLLGYTARTRFDEGLKQFINWYRQSLRGIR